MQRYFVNNNQINGSSVFIEGDDFHHITRVMRMKIGEEVIVVNELEIAFLCEISSLNEDQVVLNIIKELDTSPELPVRVILAHGLVKADKFEFIIQKATELGIREIYPVAMKRSIVKLDDKKASKKLERWGKIAKEAAEQSHRHFIPIIHDVISMKDLLSIPSEVKIVAYEEIAKENNHKMLKQVLKSLSKNGTILLVVGPEGGIDSTEINKLVEQGFIPTSLGPRILRTETAPLYVLSAISYELEL